MPIDDLTALGQKMREARKKKDLTQQELADLSHVSVKQIANIEKGKMNPSYLILRALAKVLHISLDTLINPDISLEDEGTNQMKMLYSSCPPPLDAFSVLLPTLQGLYFFQFLLLADRHLPVTINVLFSTPSRPLSTMSHKITDQWLTQTDAPYHWISL